MTDMEKKAFEQKMEARLEKWEAQVQIMRARAKEAGAETKAEIAKELDELEERSDAARNKLRDVRKSSGQAWEDLKGGIEDSWRAFERALAAAGSRFD
jgi:hypothetical protein